MPASTWFQQCEEWNMPGVSLQPMWFWILFSLIPIYTRMYICIWSTYTTCTYTHTWGVKIPYPYTKKVIYCHPLGFPASLDLSGEPSRCLSGARWHPDGCISCCLLLSRIWVEIDQFAAPRINKPYMTRYGRHSGVALYGNILDPRGLFGSIGRHTLQPCGIFQAVGVEVALKPQLCQKKRHQWATTPPLKNLSPSSRKFLGPWKNFWPLKKHPNAHHFFGSKPQAGLLMGLDIGYIAGVKSRDPKTSKREMLREWTGWPDGRWNCGSIDRFMGDSTSPRTVVVYIYTYTFFVWPESLFNVRRSPKVSKRICWFPFQAPSTSPNGRIFCRKYLEII